MNTIKENKWDYIKNKAIVLVIAIIVILLVFFINVRRKDVFSLKKEGVIIPNACILTTSEEVFVEEVRVDSPVIDIPNPIKKFVLRNYDYVEPTGEGNNKIVEIALSQVGNKGGEIYWSWYGFKSRVEWCGAFISWVSKEAGIGEDVIPKFAKANDGAKWFINHKLFRNRTYTPREGDLIFFDWDFDGKADHVGFVSSVQNKKVYTIEGNRDEDECVKKIYSVNSDYIFGYGTPNY